MKDLSELNFEGNEPQKKRINQVAAIIKSGDVSAAVLEIDQYAADGYDLNFPAYNDKQTFYDPTLLMIASAYGNQVAAEHLIAMGVDTRKKNSDGLDAYVHAAKNGHLGIMQLLARHGCDFKNAKQYGTMNAALYWAARYGQFEAVKFLEKQEVDLQGKGIEGYGLLHAAAESGNVDLIQYLLSRGFDPNAVGSDRLRDVTPLMEAAGTSNNPEAVRVLIAAGGDVKRKDAFSRTALSLTGGTRAAEIKQILLEAGADPKTEGETGLVAFSFEAEGLGVDPISENVKNLAASMLRDRYKPKHTKKDDTDK